MSQVVFSENDFNDFRNWLELDLDSITWQGKYKKEFEVFWTSFFEDETNLELLSERFIYIISEVENGSVATWFSWLRDKFFIYVFIQKNISIEELASQASLEITELATLLRNYFIMAFPHLEVPLSEAFCVGNVLSKNVNRNFYSIKSEYHLILDSSIPKEDNVMTSLEVTLFDGWNSFVKKMKIDFGASNFSFKLIRDKATFIQQIRILQEVGILVLVFFVITLGFRQGNIFYEKFLLEKVSIYEPKFYQLGRGLFKSTDLKPAKEFKLNFDEIKDITKGEKLTEFFDPEKYEEETEVTLTSFDSIPKDFKSADKETSLYEGDAENPNGYRETSNGTTKIYRLMMTSSNTYMTRDELNQVVKKFKAEPVGDSIPGMDVPGGVYYNIYVPKADFKSFILDTMKVNKAKLFESSTSNVKNVPGKVRVFIMVKSI
jgi:hypothetical protein